MSYNTLRALLITSLIVNTLLIGYIIGGATSKQRPKWSPPMMLKDFHRDTFMGEKGDYLRYSPKALKKVSSRSKAFEKPYVLVATRLRTPSKKRISTQAKLRRR